MARYLISFDRGWMNVTAQDLPEVAAAAGAVMAEAAAAGVFVFAGGIDDEEQTTLVGADGSVTDGPYPETKEMVGGFAVLEVPHRDEAVAWAEKIAVACRCAQEVREIMPDPRVDTWMAPRPDPA